MQHLWDKMFDIHSEMSSAESEFIMKRENWYDGAGKKVLLISVILQFFVRLKTS